ncbi:MAG: helix-turn-helix domain-containing protein, partial [Pseudomonadota bacterium]|nr:helix-turn-helix domain-containing protein [Pseudomonadota bacterium]
ADAAESRLAMDRPPPTRRLADELGLSPAWLAEAWRSTVGEGIGQALRRRRVATAANLLRVTALPAAQIAAAAGFCDQSHMIRAFHAVLGRTPAQVRAEWQKSSH